MTDWLVLHCQPFRIARARNRTEMYEILSWQECLMKLRHNEYCPIHRSLSCCGRELTHRVRSLQPSVRRVEDPHHPRGIRGTSIARGNAQTPKAEGQGTERNNAQSVIASSSTTTTSCQTIGIRRGWGLLAR